jgi:hypothetical protein
MSTQRSIQLRISGITSIYDDVFRFPQLLQCHSSLHRVKNSYDDIFKGFSTLIKNSSIPVFDAHMYDDVYSWVLMVLGTPPSLLMIFLMGDFTAGA